MTLTFPLLVIFDDSLHNNWHALSVRKEGVVPLEFDSAMDVGRLHGRRVTCGQSIRATFKQSAEMLVLRASAPIVVTNATAPLMLSLAFVLGTDQDPTAVSGLPCDPTPTRGQCQSAACVALRLQGTHATPYAAAGHPKWRLRRRRRLAETVFVPLCGSRQGPPVSTVLGQRWQHMEVPFEQFGIRGKLDELVFVRGAQYQRDAVAAQYHTEPPKLVMHLDEISISAARPPLAGDFPPSYGRGDLNDVESGWLQGVALNGAAGARISGQRPDSCEYMNPEPAHSQGQEERPLCHMDGDHLRGRWMQTCDPHQIQRPDHFAYGRALPEMKGWYDYRLCYRQSATERMRSQEAISWSWRPDSCALAPVRGEAFDRRLGARQLLLIGDSLMTQLYYSLVWLMGGAVLEQRDLFGYAPGALARKGINGSTVLGTCESTAGNEGGWTSQAKLRGGGTITKVMRHGDLVHELRDVDRAFWLRWVKQADLIVFNMGHHYHQSDPTFSRYGEMVQLALRGLSRHMKPTAQLIFRTTNVGHHGCQKDSKPLSSPREAWERLTTSKDIFEWRPPQADDTGKRKKGREGGVDMFKDKYNWRGPAMFETAWAAEATRVVGLSARFSVLNVSFLDARADGHVATSMRYSNAKFKSAFPLDCLHYCLPGPADFWALTLYNFIMNNPRFAL